MERSLRQAAEERRLLANATKRHFRLKIQQEGDFLVTPENIRQLIQLAKELNCAESILALDTERSELRRFNAGEINTLTWRRSALLSFRSRNCYTLLDWLDWQQEIESTNQLLEWFKKQVALIVSCLNSSCLGNGAMANTCLGKDSHMQSSVVSDVPGLRDVVKELLLDSEEGTGPVLQFTHASEVLVIPLTKVALFAQLAGAASFGMLLASFAAPRSEVQRFNLRQTNSLDWQTGSKATVENHVSFTEWLETRSRK